MSLSMRNMRPCTQLPAAQRRVPQRCCCTVSTQPARPNSKKLTKNVQQVKILERLLDPIDDTTSTFPYRFMPRPAKLGKKWKEYQGISNWDGLLDPLDDNLRSEILRYGKFIEATYNSFDFDPSSLSYATSMFPRSSLFERAGLPDTGYRKTKNLRATSGIQLPSWIEMAPSWVATQSI